MKDLTLIVLAAGESSRFGTRAKKQWLRCGDEPLWLYVTKRLEVMHAFQKVIVVGAPNELFYMREFADYEFVSGGDTRQESLKNALATVQTGFVATTDVARACIEQETLDRLMAAANGCDCAVPYIPAVDSVVYGEQMIDRQGVRLIQTPQISRTEILKKALQTTQHFTDDSSAIKTVGGKVEYILGDKKALKITHFDDLRELSCLPPPASHTFSGIGFDAHAFEEGKKCMLCGVEVDFSLGFAAHSDGDVAIHALIDAIFGAAGLGDIGFHYSDKDAKYKGTDSRELLKTTVSLVQSFGFEIVNVDLTIVAQQPRLEGYKDEMRSVMAQLLNIPRHRTSIKATTTEKMGFVGRGEGVAVMAVATLRYFDWTKN